METCNIEGCTAPESPCVGGSWEYRVKYRVVLRDNQSHYQSYYQSYYQPRCYPGEYYPENVRERLEICAGKSASV